MLTPDPERKMVRRRGIATKEVVLGIAAVVLIVAAVLIYVRSDRSTGPSDTVMLGFTCQQCKQESRISERDFEKMFNRHEFRQGSDGRTMLFKCPRCGQMAAVRSDGPADEPPPAPADEGPKPAGG